MERLRATFWQRTLFVAGNSSLLSFVHLEKISEADFTALIREACAKYVIDLRTVPRFDIGALTRKIVFALFEGVGSKYLDLSGRLGVTDRRDAKLNPRILAHHLRETFDATKYLVEGPIILLVDAVQFSNEYVTALSDEMHALRPEGWDVFRFPALESKSGQAQTSSQKKTIFISHANPEDNEFAKWLGVQLTLAGYQIWSDVTKLIGGETFWNSIEEAIREYSAKVIVVISRAAQMKAGVLDEINCAVSVERAAGLDNFVLPIRLDKIPFDQVRANLARKNIIDFSENWAEGLNGVIRVLQRDSVSRVETDAGTIATWARMDSRSTQEIVKVPELLVSNWIPIQALPSSMAIYATEELMFSVGGEILPQGDYTHVKMGKHVARFRTQSILADTRTELIFDTAHALRHGVPEPIGLTSRQVSNLATNLLRQLWGQAVSRKGLLGYQMSAGVIAWYPPTGLIDGDNVSFRDLTGKVRRKYLVGRSEKRNVFWHLALEARPTIARQNRFALISHVVFTEDGKSKLVSPARMHALRRQFCKNWWNDRWRDLMLGYLAWLSEGDSQIILRDGPDEVLRLLSRPLSFQSPVSVSQPSSESHFNLLLQDMEWEDLDVLDSGDEETSDFDELGDAES
jgi:hypothetical protein